MHLTKRELRALPIHALIDLVELLYVEWRFSDRDTALEGTMAAAFQRAAHELDRRRQRLLRGKCTCAVCFAFVQQLSFDTT